MRQTQLIPYPSLPESFSVSLCRTSGFESYRSPFTTLKICTVLGLFIYFPLDHGHQETLCIVSLNFSLQKHSSLLINLSHVAPPVWPSPVTSSFPVDSGTVYHKFVVWLFASQQWTSFSHQDSVTWLFCWNFYPVKPCIVHILPK